jgi:hypothetical protein
MIDTQFGNFSGSRSGVLNKDPTVWLDGVRPANTCILCPRNCMSYQPPKNVCMYKEITDKIAESFIAMLYISATIVLSNRESTNSSVVGSNIGTKTLKPSLDLKNLDLGCIFVDLLVFAWTLEI